MRLLPLLLLAACPSSEPDGDDTDPPAEDSVDTDASATWRSALYPEDWTPAHTLEDGRFLHDVSYAGYHAGEVSLPATLPEPVLDVRDYGAVAQLGTDSADAIQDAIDALPDGGTVYLPEGAYTIGRRLDVTRSGVVVAGDGPDRTRLAFTHAGVSGDAGLRFRGATASAEDAWPLAEDGAPRATTVRVTDPSGLAPGDLVAVGWTITPAFVADHGMTDTWTVFVDQWKPFFRRTVVAVDGDVVTLDVPLRYDALVRDGAALRPDDGYLTEVGVRDLAVTTVVAESIALDTDRHHALELDRVMDGWVSNVATWAPDAGPSGPHLQSGGIYVQRSRRVTVADTSMGPVQNNLGGGNGYLFEVSRSSEVLIRDSEGRGGRHNFIQNWDFGTSGCVFLRTRSTEGVADNGPVSVTGVSEFHHSLAMANLIDQSTTDDGWACKNRHGYSSGAGHAGTQNVFWNTSGTGELRSMQYGMGYVVGTAPELTVVVDPAAPDLTLGGVGTEPMDHAEGLGEGATLAPPSLYDDQLARRLATD